MMTGANIDCLTDNPADVLTQINDLNVRGCKLLRWQLVNDIYAMANWTQEYYDWWLGNRLWVLDQCLPTTIANQQPIIIDFHHPYMGMKKKGQTQFFFNNTFMEHHIKVVKETAARYKDNPGVFAIEFVNEPFPDSSHQLNDFYTRICGEVVSVGWNKHMVLDHATAQIKKISDLKPVNFNNIWYSGHIWPSFTLDKNSGTWNSSESKCRDLMERMINWQKKYKDHLAATNSRMLLGEFGCLAASGKERNQAPYLRDMRATAIKYDWDWLWLGTSYYDFRWKMNDQNQWNTFWQ